MENLKGIQRVFIYLRKSRDNGDGVESLDNHKRALLEICRRNNWNDVKIWEEIGTSQSIEDRPQFKEMLEEIRKGEADLVLAMDIDRLSRGSLGEWQTIKDVFKKSATFFMNAMGTVYDYNNIDSTFTSDLLSVLANYEYQQIRKRLARGRKASFEKGAYPSGVAPLGYTYNFRTKKLEVDEAGAKVYGLMTKLSLDGYTDSQIARQLNDLGIKTSKGCKWVGTSVYRVLTNPTYKGDTVFKRATGSHKDGTYKQLPVHLWEINHGTHEALISAEDFDRIQAQLAARNITPVNARRGVHILSGLVYCGHCGRLHSITIPQKGKTSSYVKPCKNCHKKGIDSIILEDVVSAESKKLLQQVQEGKPEVAGRVKELKTRIEAGEKTAAQKKQGLDRLTDLYIDGLLDKEQYKTKQAALQEEVKAAEHEVKEARKALKDSKGEDLPGYTERVKKLISAWNRDDISKEEKNRLAKGLLKGVSFKREGNDLEISVEFN